MDTDLLSLLGLPPSTLKWFLQACCCSVAICLLHQLTCDAQVEGDLLAPGLMAVLLSISVPYLLHYQILGAAFGLQAHA